MGFSVMLWGAEKLVPAEYWCPYGTTKVGKDSGNLWNLHLVNLLKMLL